MQEKVVRSKWIHLFKIIYLYPLGLIIWLILESLDSVRLYSISCDSFKSGMDLLDLQILSDPWNIYRNYGYLGGILILILLGLIIIVQKLILNINSQKHLFQKKFLDSITEIIPVLIFYLLLLTFSYGIAGLYLDVWNFFRCLF